MDNAKELLDKYLRNECTAQEKQFLERWFHEQHIEDNINLTPSDYNEARNRLLVKFKQTNHKPVVLWQVWSVAASLLVFISVGLYLYLPSRNTKHQIAKVANTKLNKPLLVVNDTRKIVLTNEEPEAEEVTKLQEKDGSTLYAFENKKVGFFQEPIRNTLMTPRQQILKMKLPDGSLVWLNSLSEISFNANFEDEDYREVELKGEAYFEVAKNPKKPFRVVTQGQVVQVLGTHFNISTNKQGGTSTSLLEGSVAVEPISKNDHHPVNKVILKPGQQSVLANNSFRIKDFDEELLLDWKQGDFLFKKDLLQNIVKRLSLWYGVDFVVEESEIAEQTFSGRLSRSITLEEALSIIEKSCNVKFEKEGSKYRLSKQIAL